MLRSREKYHGKPSVQMLCATEVFREILSAIKISNTSEEDAMFPYCSTRQLNIRRSFVLLVVTTILATLCSFNTGPVFAEGAPECQVMVQLSDTEEVRWIPYEDGSLRATTTYSGIEMRSDCDAVLVQKWRNGKLVESYPVIAEESYLIIEYEYFYTGDEGGADEIAFLINYATDHATVYRLRHDAAGAETQMHQAAAIQQAAASDPTPVPTSTPEPLIVEQQAAKCQVNLEYTTRNGLPGTLAAFVDKPSSATYDSWETNGDRMTLNSNCRVMISWYTKGQIQNRSLFDPATDHKLIVPFEYAGGAERSELVQFVTVPENGPTGRQVVMVNVQFVQNQAAVKQVEETLTPTEVTNQEETMLIPSAVLLALVVALTIALVAQLARAHALAAMVQQMKVYEKMMQVLGSFDTRLDVLGQVWGGVERANHLAAQLSKLQGSVVTGVRGTHFIVHRNGEVLRFTVATELNGSNATRKLQHLCQLLGLHWNKMQDDVRQVYINGQDTRLYTCHHNFSLGDTVEIWFR